MPVLDRRIPSDWKHVELHPAWKLIEQTVATVERRLPIPSGIRAWYNQGNEGACVGFGTSQSLTIQMSMLSGHLMKYDAEWLYLQAQLVDEWPETPPEEGSSVRAAMDVLRKIGAMLVRYGHKLPGEGIASNQWATTVDEMRTAIANGQPVTLGINWYDNFDNPVHKGREYWIGEGDLGRVRGGHCLCECGASDDREAFLWSNSWGALKLAKGKWPDNWAGGYPLVWVPYRTVERLLNEYGEAAIMRPVVKPAP